MRDLSLSQLERPGRRCLLHSIRTSPLSISEPFMRTTRRFFASSTHLSKRRFLPAGLFLAFASGATALVYEVLWKRQFINLFGAIAPAVSATLSAIFFGFAAGNAFIGSRPARWPRALRAYGLLEVGVGLTALLVMPLIGIYEQVYPALHGKFFGRPTVFLVVKSCLAAAALFLPAFLMGGTLPLLAQAFVAVPGSWARWAAASTRRTLSGPRLGC